MPSLLALFYLSPLENPKQVMVWNLWPEGEKLEEILADGKPGTIPESAIADSHQLTALIMGESCQKFYLIHRESRDKLHDTNRVAWELL